MIDGADEGRGHRSCDEGRCENTGKLRLLDEPRVPIGRRRGTCIRVHRRDQSSRDRVGTGEQSRTLHRGDRAISLDDTEDVGGLQDCVVGFERRPYRRRRGECVVGSGLAGDAGDKGAQRLTWTLAEVGCDTDLVGGAALGLTPGRRLGQEEWNDGDGDARNEDHRREFQ